MEIASRYRRIVSFAAALCVLLTVVAHIEFSTPMKTLQIIHAYDITPYLSTSAVSGVDSGDCTRLLTRCILRTRDGNIISFESKKFSFHKLLWPADSVSCDKSTCYSISSMGITDIQGKLVMPFNGVRRSLGKFWNFQCLEGSRCMGVSTDGCVLSANLHRRLFNLLCVIPLLGEYEDRTLSCDEQFESKCLLVSSRGTAITFTSLLRVKRSADGVKIFGSKTGIPAFPFDLACPDVGCALIVGDSAVFRTRSGWMKSNWRFETRVVEAACVESLKCLAIDQDGRVMSFSKSGQMVIGSTGKALKIQSGDTAVQSLKCSEQGLCVAVSNSNVMLLFRVESR